MQGLIVNRIRSSITGIIKDGMWVRHRYNGKYHPEPFLIHAEKDLERRKALETGAAEEQPDYEDPKDRNRIIPVEVSINYLKSTAYTKTYGDKKVWELYRRNFPRGYKNIPTRMSCVNLDDGKLLTNHPCPICRDIYLVVDYRNTELLGQFVKEYTGIVMEGKKTGVCQVQWAKIELAIEKAKLHGLMSDYFDPYFVKYDESQYKDLTKHNQTKWRTLTN